MTKLRTGQAPPFPMPRKEFTLRFHQSYADPAFEAEAEALVRLEAIAWDAYLEGRKSPVTVKAGKSFHDPSYDLSKEWLETRNRVRAAERQRNAKGARSRVLVVCGSTRNDGTCPGEMSKTYRLAEIIERTLGAARVETDLLDLSRLASDFGRRIYPCKACVSTAQPLCHWPCSCYPNHALNQVGDWMGEIYERWAAAHGVILCTPVNWYHASSSMKLMIDRLVCADGGNPDPTLTQGKDPKLAKKVELAGWDYPKHLAGRAYGLVIHGDVAGTDDARKALGDWLDWMGLIDAGAQAKLDRYIGYYEPYATSHDALDRDKAVQEEARNVARAVANAVAEIRAGRLKAPDRNLERPRPK